MEDVKELQKLYRCRSEKDVSLGNGISEYQYVSLFRLRDVYSRVLNIPVDEVFDTRIKISFFSALFVRRPSFNYNNIASDILSGMINLELAMKYHEPECVLNEAREKINNNKEFIISSKIYNSKEVTELLQDVVVAAHTMKDIAILSEAGKNSVQYWQGESLKKNLNKILFKLRKCESEYTADDNVVYITRKEAVRKLKVTLDAFSRRVNSGKKTFGVKVRILNPDRKNKSRSENLYFAKEDIENAVKNKKYYVNHSDIIIARTGRNSNKDKTLLKVKKEFKARYDKNINFINRYIKKETLIKFLEIAEELGYKDAILKEKQIKKDKEREK